MYQKKIRQYAPTVMVFFLIILLWQITDYLFDIREIILPSPIEIAMVIVNDFDILLRHGAITAIESVFGFLLGSVLALVIAIWFSYSRKSKQIFYPYSIILKASPLYALAPLLTLWFGSGMLAKIVMSSLVAFFPVLISAVHGFGQVAKSEMDLMRSIGASKAQIFWKLRVPRSLPFIFPALKISTTLAVVGATIAEFTGSNAGIGYLITTSSYYMETSMMFASIMIISLVGLAFFGAITLLEKRVIFWRE